MSEFQYLDGGNSEAQDRLATSYLLRQSARGIARTAVLAGLEAAQTATPSGSIVLQPGAAAVQESVLTGVAFLVNDVEKTLDVLGLDHLGVAHPMGALPRWDIVVFDSILKRIITIYGTPHASPTDPTVPATACKLQRIRHAANAVAIPNSAIDDLRTFTALAGAPNRGSVTGVTLSASGTWTVTHGIGSTPTVTYGAVGFGGAADEYTFRTESRNATTFVVVVYRNGVVATGHTFPAGYGFDWVAVP